MPKRLSIHKHPQDESRLAKSILDVMTTEGKGRPAKKSAAVALGGQKGGKARAEKLSARRRKQME
ncbi:MAG TPA: hypothetical protein VFX96_15235 [Pyrinomonadaceae bacterium]|nr:hypothetical protein [Pyrinomonadaceae bacterium]